jgi:hypothetical protein
MGRPPVLSAAVLLGVTVFGSSWVPSQPSELVMEAGLLSRLQTLADGLHNEIVLCLNGVVRGDTAYASDFDMPGPRESTPMRSSFDPCPRGTLASWHNHPSSQRSGAFASLGESLMEKRARRLCVLSQIDIATAERLRYPFAVVSVDADTWCWWTLREVEGFARDSVAPGPPAPARLAGREATSDWSSPGARSKD